MYLAHVALTAQNGSNGERDGPLTQHIEVSAIFSVPSPGYTTDPAAISAPAGLGRPQPRAAGLGASSGAEPIK